MKASTRHRARAVLAGDPSRPTIDLGAWWRRRSNAKNNKQQTTPKTTNDSPKLTADGSNDKQLTTDRSSEAPQTAEMPDEHDLYRYRMPVQVCPRGCGYHELARRELISSTRFWGKVDLHVDYKFETINCPNCGAQLDRKCVRCGREFFAPVVDRCQFCGLPQPWAAERREGAERASIRLWRPKGGKKSKSKRRAHDPALLLYRLKGSGDVWVIDGDIAHLAVDAVVSNDDIDGQMWAQVASAIKNAAGKGVERFAQDGKPFRLGQAWVTAPGALQHMKGIVHVASMTRNGESTIETVRKCLTAALKLATKEGYASIGIGAIGSGPRGAIEPSKWFETFAEVTTEHLSDRTKRVKMRSPISIVLVLFEPADFKEDLATLHQAFWDAWVQLKRPSRGKPSVRFEILEQQGLDESTSGRR